MKTMRICLINSTLNYIKALESLGHTVLNLVPPAGTFFDLQAALDEQGFTPDLVLQLECLGDRALLTNTASLDCPMIFWAVDPHLNSHWHASYARLFDQTLSTQGFMIPHLKRFGATDVRWLPPNGIYIPWVDMKERPNLMTFVGRLGEQRPARQWMVDYLGGKLAPGELRVEQSLTFQEMMQLYQHTRIIPNESILGEVNFRLFEAASCGCLVLSQDLGDEQASLFEPGREMDTYADVAELDEKIDYYLKHPDVMERMGRAAHDRLSSEHMGLNRMLQFLEYAQDASRNRATGPDHDKWTAVTVAAMWETGMIRVSAREVLDKLAPLQQDADVVTATLRIQAVVDMKPVMEENIQTLLGGKFLADSLDVNLAGSAAALRLGNWDGAKAFWYRHLQSINDTKTLPPASPAELLSLWAKELKRHNRVFRGGFTFNPLSHLPHTAMDCLLLALQESPEDGAILRLMDTLLRPHRELDQVRIGFLSMLTLRERDDWRLAFESAMANLRCYRLQPGMDELRFAHSMAREQGQERAFAMALKGRDVSGTIRRRLESSQG